MKKHKRTPSIRTSILSHIRRKWYYILPLLLIVIAALLGLQLLVRDDNHEDFLLYTVMTEEGLEALIHYDNNTEERTLILTEDDFININLSADGRLAYTLNYGRSIELFVRETLSPDSPTVHISRDVGYFSMIGWSADGRYLAFFSRPDYQTDAQQVYIWDGETVINITPDNLILQQGESDTAWSLTGHELALCGNGIHVWDGETTIELDPINYVTSCKVGSDSTMAWSLNGHLAFAQSNRQSSDIYVWDGQTITNVSQTSTTGEYNPSWNRNGELAFLTFNSDYILVWDGVSVANGVPDVNTFTQINIPTQPELELYHSLYWVNDDSLAFIGSYKSGDPRRLDNRSFIWDGQTITTISDGTNDRVSAAWWSADGRVAFKTVATESEPSLIKVWDRTANIIFSTQSDTFPIWNADSDLIFCRYIPDADEWSLNVWNGREIIEIVQGENITGGWQSGAFAGCGWG